MSKTLVPCEQIAEMLNAKMKISEALGGDCRECRVRRVGRVTDMDARLLGRNWDVDMVNGECKGDCLEVLREVASVIGNRFDVLWT